MFFLTFFRTTESAELVCISVFRFLLLFQFILILLLICIESFSLNYLAFVRLSLVKSEMLILGFELTSFYFFSFKEVMVNIIELNFTGEILITNSVNVGHFLVSSCLKMD